MKQGFLMMILVPLLISGCSGGNPAPGTSPAGATVAVSVPSLVPRETISPVQPSTSTEVTGTTEGTNAKPIASLPEHGMALFADPKGGVILRIGQREQPMNWIYETPRMMMPVMQADDFDSDGEKELAVVLNIGSGTGVSVDELHVIEYIGIPGGLQPFTDHTFHSKDYMSQLQEELRFEKVAKDGHLFGRVTVGSQNQEFPLRAFQKDYGEAKLHEELGYGSIVRFSVEMGELVCSAAVGLLIDGVAEPQYFGTVEASVRYASGKFMLQHFRFTLDPEFPTN